MSMQYDEIADACGKSYLPEEEFNYNNNVDWDDEYEQTYCDDENQYEIVEEIDILGNKIKKKVFRNNTN
jgi:hypothetical protein